MEKSFLEQMGGTYYKQGDYFLHNHTVPKSIPSVIGASGDGGISGDTVIPYTPLCLSAVKWTLTLPNSTFKRKKCFLMGLISAKLWETAAHVIAMSVLVLNLRKVQCAILWLL